MRTPTRRLSLLLIASLPWFAGCRATTPALASRPAPPPRENALLVAHIGDEPFLTAESGYRAVYALWRDGAAFDGDFAALAGELESNQIIDPRWEYSPEQFLDRASVGYMFCRAMGIEGLNWSISGMGRYAWRELIYRRIARPSGELGLLTGGEFLALLSRAEEYLRETTPSSTSLELGTPEERPVSAPELQRQTQ